MKVGARLVTVDPLLLFKTNNWKKNQDIKTSNTTQNKFEEEQDECWMKEEVIDLEGAVSWNRGDDKKHCWYLYTKVRDDWRCNACTLINSLTLDTCVSGCQELGYQSEQRKSKRQRIK
jgi:hypothetical protein